jgi:mono/diheme cytochrome c family protein
MRERRAMSRSAGGWARGVIVGVAVAGLLVALLAWLNVRGEASIVLPADAVDSSPQALARGDYLARAGNCAACHTERGGAPYAGGRGIETPFGTVYASNLTPDDATGLGRWSPDHFWRALHHGRSIDGRLLYPAFPYPSYTQVTRADADALYAFLRSQPAVAKPNRPHALRFPYNTQAALAVWRALFFRAEAFEPRTDRSAEWNRGAYLVQGLGHCVACHSTRNAFGATGDRLDLSGGLIPMQRWYAPSLVAADEASVAAWDVQRIVDLLRTGTSPHGSVMGPMAEVVLRSTQHLSDEDLRAMAVFLKALPQQPAAARTASQADGESLRRGQAIYEERCASCHGEQGQGAPGAYPPLAGSRKVQLASSVNLIRTVLHGGFPPATAGNPRPYGMPPFGQDLGDADVAAVVTYLRNAWGNSAPPVGELEVLKLR